jgi:hypothetical protein
MANREKRLRQQRDREDAEAGLKSAFASKQHQHEPKRDRSSFVWQNYVGLVEPYKQFWLRRPEDWEMRLKTARHDRILNNFVSFVFDKRPAPKALGDVWIVPAEGLPLPAPVDFRLWYIHAVQERSIYKTVAKGLLTAKEVHHLTTSPLAELSEALWYAVAMAAAPDHAVARAIAHMARPVEPHHFEWARWLARQAQAEEKRLSYREIDDLTDYYYHKVAAARDEARQREANRHSPGKLFTLKGRTIKTMEEGMSDWHHELRRREKIGGGSWSGMPIPDSTFDLGGGEWWFRQIKTGDDLWDEGNKMRHCVAFYKGQCIEGSRAIWALAVDERSGMGWRRALTIEVVPRSGEIVQARGFANRPPTAKERSVLDRWALRNSLRVTST